MAKFLQAARKRMEEKGTVGKFTRMAHKAGKSVGQLAKSKLHAGGTIGKEANFARMAKRHWKPLGKGK